MKKTGTYNEKGDKWCSHHKEYHHKSLFGRNHVSRDGIDWQCIDSRRVQANTRWDRINDSIELAAAVLAEMKLTKVYEYKRPDAYDIYLQQQSLLTKTHTNESRY